MHRHPAHARLACHIYLFNKELVMSLFTLLMIVLILMLLGALPTWPHSRSWGYGPSGGVGLILVVLIILMLMGRL